MTIRPPRPHLSRWSRSAVAASAAALALVLIAGLAACSSSKKAARGDTSAAAGDTHTASITITAAEGCVADRTQFAAGGITVNITNRDATAVSEVEVLSGARILGEKENLPPGFEGSFAVNVAAGTYTLYCPGAAKEKTTLTVTGAAATNTDTTLTALLKTATDGYATYVNTQVSTLLDVSTALNTALHGRDLTAAQDAYKKARPYYEKIEPVAESFTVGKESLDADIDAREGDVPAAQWTGFHRIEKALFQAKTLTGLGALGDGLVSDVTRLQTLTKDLTYQPTELANGAQELLDEVAASKITGEEERYSHIDLLDVANNVEGSEQAFAQLQPALSKIDAALSANIAVRFAALDKLVDGYRTKRDTSGYQLYTELDTADKKNLAAAVKAVQEPLSKVASKVANA
jgi:iron uptake system component EfeO